MSTLDLYLLIGYNGFMKPKIEFVSLVEGLESIEECRPKPAKHFIPQWFKDIPSKAPSTVKICPSFTDYFSMGYIMPMWTDVKIEYDKETTDYKWSTPDETFILDIHGNNQLIDHVTPNLHGINGQFVFKTMCPWKIITPKGWSTLQLPLFYNFNKEFSTFPGIVDTDIFHDLNQQILYHGTGEEITIKRGTPFALYVPFKRDGVYLDAEIRDANDQDKKRFTRTDLNFKTMFTPGIYRKMQRERDRDVR
jgi:hypothetical protein